MNTDWINDFHKLQFINADYLKEVRQTLWESELKEYETAGRTQKQLLPKYQKESESKVVGMFVKYINTKSNFANIKQEKNIVSFKTTKEDIQKYRDRIVDDKELPGKKLKDRMNKFLEILTTEKTHLHHLFKLMLCPFKHFERLSYLSFKLLAAHLEFYVHFEGTINSFLLGYEGPKGDKDKLEKSGQTKELSRSTQPILSFMVGLDALFNAYLGVSTKEAEAEVMKLSMDIGSLQEKISKKEDEAQAMKPMDIGSLQEEISKKEDEMQKKISELSELSFSNIVYCFVGWINVMPITDYFRKSFMDIFNSLVHRPTYLMLFTIQMVGKMDSIPHSTQSKESMQLLSDWLKIRAKPDSAKPNRWLRLAAIKNLAATIRPKKTLETLEETLKEGELKPSFELNLQNAAEVFNNKVHSLCTAWTDSMKGETSSYVNQDDSDSTESLMKRISSKLFYINTINGLLEDQLVKDLKESMTDKENDQFDEYRIARERQKVSEVDIEESSRTTTTDFSFLSSTDEDDVDVQATVTISVNVGQETSEIQVDVNEEDTFETLESSIQNAFFGLKWREVIRNRDITKLSQSGRKELRHEQLKEALLTKTEISMQEFEEFNLKRILMKHHYIVSEGRYYVPTPVNIIFENHTLRLDNANSSPVDKNKKIFEFILDQSLQKSGQEDGSLKDQIRRVQLKKSEVVEKEKKDEVVVEKERKDEEDQSTHEARMLKKAWMLEKARVPSAAPEIENGVDESEWNSPYGSLSRRLRKREMLREA